ncbi:MAG: 7TM diverse intracellular signaling domain-containing protein [Flammeovirgaceae bacterium]
MLHQSKVLGQSFRISISSDTVLYQLNQQLLIINDQDDELDIHTIVKKAASDFEAIDFVLNEDGVLTFPNIETTGSVWSFIEIKNSLSKDFEGVLTTGLADYAELYIPNEDATTYLQKKSGKVVPVSERDFSIGDYTVCAFKVKVPAFQSVKLFIKHRSLSNNLVSFDILCESLRHWEVRQLKVERIQFLFMGLVIGFMGIMAAYNLLIFFLSRDRIYLYYSMYIVLPMVYILNVQGFFVNTFIGEYATLYFYIRVITPCIAVVFYLLFARRFLSIPEHLPKWDRFFKILIWAESINAIYGIIIVPITINEFLIRSIPTLVHMITLTSIIVLLFVITKKNNKMAMYFTSAAVCFIGGALFFATASIIFKVASYQTGLIVQTVGIALELIIYSLGLGYRIRMLDNERRRAQEENARILREQNSILEEKVIERTREIEQQKEEILTQNEELHQQQEEIITQRDYIEEQNVDLRHKNEQITDSIRYAKTIQEALLPFKTRLSENLSEYFIIYRPKDIVSGDFYWFEKIGNKNLMAVVDCTGHGVPGGFMSMIGISVLNDIVIKNQIIDPATILFQLDETINKVLKQDEEGNQDGMDLAFCTFETLDTGQVKVIFAGAKRPLYYAEYGQEEIQELKGDRCAIGGYHAREVMFTNQEVMLPKGSVLYLTTDGIADQHNTQNQKFGSPRLKNLLSRIHHLPMAGQQKTIIEVLELHQQDQIQRDDIAVVGIRL